MKAKYILYLLAIITFGSCQKVIDVDLNDSNAVIVIEANYSAEDSTVRVSVTKTSSYFDNSSSPVVDDATVTIIDFNGTPQSVVSIGNGQYELAGYVPIFNSTYTLQVVHNGTLYEATCTMNSVVNLEDMTYEFFPGFFGSAGGYVVYMNFNDPAGTVNFYEAVLTRNGDALDKLDEIFLQDDQLTDGNLVERPLFASDFFELNDTIGMELRSIDEKIYDYKSEAISAAAQNSGAPGNPNPVWTNGALGYFSCYSSSRKEVIIL